jgi:hypothetical protein
MNAIAMSTNITEWRGRWAAGKNKAAPAQIVGSTEKRSPTRRNLNASETAGWS